MYVYHLLIGEWGELGVRNSEELGLEGGGDWVSL